MGVGRVSGTAHALIIIFLLTSCGGVGVKTRDSLVKERPGPGKNIRQTAAAEEKNINKTERASAESRTAREAGGVEEYFKQWLNVPYKFGGNNFNGIDCSGLIHNFFSDYYGIDVSRTTISLYYASKSISAETVQPGDLVFFQNTYRPGISHVGVMLDKERFVHAGSSGVTVTNLSDSYFKKRLVGFRRISK